jgi:hypothetical protein
MSTIISTKIFKIERYINFSFRVLTIQRLAVSVKILKTKMKTYLKLNFNKINKSKEMIISINKKENLIKIIIFQLKKKS